MAQRQWMNGIRYSSVWWLPGNTVVYHSVGSWLPLATFIEKCWWWKWSSHRRNYTIHDKISGVSYDTYVGGMFARRRPGRRSNNRVSDYILRLEKVELTYRVMAGNQPLGNTKTRSSFTNTARVEVGSEITSGTKPSRHRLCDIVHQAQKAWKALMPIQYSVPVWSWSNNTWTY